MVTLTINGQTVQVPAGTTILEAAEKAGIKIPTLCYLKDINKIAACRMCVVEVEGSDRLAAACDTPVEEGLVVHTNTPKVRKARRVNMELLLSQHASYCSTCIRSGNCPLQKLANDLNIHEMPYHVHVARGYTDTSTPLVRQASKCIKCMRCVQICEKVQTMGIWDLAGTGSRTTVDVSGNRTLKTSDCTFCGQCVTHCPTGALTARDDTVKVLDALADPEITTVVQIAPAVRVAWAESFGLTGKKAATGKMVAALRRLGFDYVFDTNFSADLTIMEEGSEFLERFTHRDRYHWPMFTSCCPGWVRFIKSQFPHYVDCLSTANSPQQMFGAVAKTYFAEKIGVDPHRMFVVSIMPCMAKKSECALPTMRDACGDPDVDAVLTTREMDRLFRSDNIQPGDLRRHGRGPTLGLLSRHRGEPRSGRVHGCPGKQTVERSCLFHSRCRGDPGGGGLRAGEYPEVDEGIGERAGPLRLRGGDGLPRRLRRRRRPAHPRRRGVGREAGRCPVEAGSEGHHPVFPRESGDSVSLPRVPGASAGKEVPPPAPYRSYNMGGCGKRYMVGL